MHWSPWERMHSSSDITHGPLQTAGRHAASRRGPACRTIAGTGKELCSGTDTGRWGFISMIGIGTAISGQRHPPMTRLSGSGNGHASMARRSNIRDRIYRAGVRYQRLQRTTGLSPLASGRCSWREHHACAAPRASAAGEPRWRADGPAWLGIWRTAHRALPCAQQHFGKGSPVEARQVHPGEAQATPGREQALPIDRAAPGRAGGSTQSAWVPKRRRRAGPGAPQTSPVGAGRSLAPGARRHRFPQQPPRNADGDHADHRAGWAMNAVRIACATGRISTSMPVMGSAPSPGPSRRTPPQPLRASEFREIPQSAAKGV